MTAKFKTFQDLITDVQKQVSQVDGIGVQVYTEGRIAAKLQHKFNVLFEEEFWSQFLHWGTTAFDGSTGSPTVELGKATDPLRRYEDIRAVFPDGSDKRVPRLPDSVNPFNIASNTRIRFISELNTGEHIFRAWPLETTETVRVHYRSSPNDFDLADEVRFDPDALVMGAAFDLLDDDGTNPGAANKFQNFFESRLSQLKRNRALLPHELDPRFPEDGIEEWTELN